MRMAKQKRPHVKTETLVVRMSPKIKYALDLISRQRQKTMSDVVERAIERMIEDPKGDLIVTENISGKAENIFDATWDDDDIRRFLSLAKKFPGLLRPMEDAIWKFINENPRRYFHSIDKETPEVVTTVYTEIDVERVRSDWDNLAKAAADGPPWNSDWMSHEDEIRLGKLESPDSHSV